jgi:hypothetical protein
MNQKMHTTTTKRGHTNKMKKKREKIIALNTHTPRLNILDKNPVYRVT